MPSSLIHQPIRALVAALLVIGACSPAWAGGHGGGHGGGRGGGGGHAAHSGGGGHVGGSGSRAFSGGGRVVAAPGWHGGVGGGPRALNNGHWFHGVRGGQVGWWWVAAAPAYLYLQQGYPVGYPYGNMAVEPVYGYFCNSYQRYYPEVQNCPEPWAIVVPGPG